MSRYRKIEVRTWGDEKFCALSPIPACGQGLWFYLLTGPHTGPIPGLFRAGRAGLAEELSWTLKDFDKAFREITSKGMAEADFKAKVIWIPNAIKHNRPESPNVIRAWAKEFDLVPECDLKWRAYLSLEAFVQTLTEPFVKAFREAFKKASSEASKKLRTKAKAYQEQEQEQEQESYPSQTGTGPGELGEPQSRVGVHATPGDLDPGWDEDLPFGTEVAA